MKLIKVEHSYYEHRFVGGGIFDSGFRSVKETDKYKFVDKDLSRVLLYFDTNEFEFEELSYKEYNCNKEYYDMLTRSLDVFIKGKENEYKCTIERCRKREEASKYVKNLVPHIYEKFREHKKKTDSVNGKFSSFHYNRANKAEARLTAYAKKYLEDTYPDLGYVGGYYTDYIF